MSKQMVIDPLFPKIAGRNAIKNLEDALIELITNCDDSYGVLFRHELISKNGGTIQIDHCESKRCITVRDFAEGMSAEKMEEVLTNYGGRQSAKGGRGSQGRGMKDAAVLGRVIIESIKDGILTKYVLETNVDYDDFPPRPVTEEDRERLGILKGNGTVITIFPKLDKTANKNKKKKKKATFTRFDNLLKNLSLHYALRKMLLPKSDTKVYLRRIDADGRVKEKKRVIYRPLAGESVVEEEFDIDGYEATAKISIYRTEKPIPEKGDKKYERFGFLIESTRGVHEITLFDRKLENELGHRYFGTLECTYIDDLVDIFQARIKSKIDHSEANPWLVIDTNRQSGIDKDHPFTEALFKRPIEILEGLIEQDRKNIIPSKDISDKKTKKYLENMSKAFVKFFIDLDDIDLDGMDGEGEIVVIDQLAVDKGIFFDPDNMRVKENKVRYVYIRAKSSLIGEGSRTIKIEAQEKRIVGILQSKGTFVPNKVNDEFMTARVKIKGLKIGEIIIKGTPENTELDPITAIVQVIEEYDADHEFNPSNDIEFEHKNYTVEEGRQKDLRLYVKYPSVVIEETEVALHKSDHYNIQCPSSCIVKPINPGRNFAIGIVKIEGRILQGQTKITAKLGDREAETNVLVVESKETDSTIPLKFDLTNEDLGERAKWRNDINEPWTLQVSVAHLALQRYYTEDSTQQSAAFDAVLTEIIAEYVSARWCIEEARRRGEEKGKADMVTSTISIRLRKARDRFLQKAHGLVRES